MPHIDRREFLGTLTSLGATTLAACITRRPARAFTLEETTIDAAQDAMKRGTLTSRRLCERYLERIAALNPRLRAVIETNPEALEIADGLDRERRTRGARGPLHGIPMVVKDNIETADRMHTTAGSPVLDGVPVLKDAFVVARLRQAGVVILGKANLTEWAGMGGRNGYSTVGGQTVNPYDTERTPLGSSAGSAVAVSANLALAGIGTETMGSILAPSSLAGVVGVKPTVGLVSRSGVVPVALSMDSVGPLTRSVVDAAHILSAIAAPDPEDRTAKSGRWGVDYGRALSRHLAGLRIGVVREPGARAEVQALFEGAVRDLMSLGATLVDHVTLPEVTEERFTDELDVMLTEFNEQFTEYVATRRPAATIGSLAEVLVANQRAGIKQPSLETAAQKGRTSDEAYRTAAARLHQNARHNGIDVAMAFHHLDAIVNPSVGPAWTFADEERADTLMPTALFLASGAGYPAVTVPMGEVGGLPVGMIFAGPAWSEATLLRCAYAYEQATHHRRPPQL